MSRASKRFHGRWWTLATDSAGYRKYLDRINGERYEGFLVCLRDGGGIVGVINVVEIIRGRLQSAFLGYSGNVAFAGTGLMTEGLRLVVAHAFTKLKLHRVEANIQPANRRSIALATRCGFRKEGFSPRYLKLGGQWRDHERWAQTVEDWRRGRAKA
jgi:ribosomal-protein-alanine N-acetyltransferase